MPPVEPKEWLDELQRAPWLGPARREWPRYAYHYSDLTNVPAILAAGRLRSRAWLAERGAPLLDAGHPEIVGQSPWAHPFVRLYFRPRTPTQYRVEGIRAPSTDPMVAQAPHCPLPVFFLFDLESLLLRPDCHLSTSNFARQGAESGPVRRMLPRLPMPYVYHDGAIGPAEDKPAIIGARCAEILVPDELELDALRAIVCRTEAEAAMLRFQAGEAALPWLELLRVERPGEWLFFKREAFVRSAVMLGREVRINVHFGRGEYLWRLEIRRENRALIRMEGEHRTPGTKELRVEVGNERAVLVSLWLGEVLAFSAPVWRLPMLVS